MLDLPEAFRMDEPEPAEARSSHPFCVDTLEHTGEVSELTTTCSLVEQLEKIRQVALSHTSGNDSDPWHTVERALRQALVAAHFQTQRHLCELAAMRDVIQCELTDREANSARVAERQQILSDRIDSSGVAFERAVQAAETIEETLIGLELQCMHKSQECGRLLAMDIQEQ